MRQYRGLIATNLLLQTKMWNTSASNGPCLDLPHPEHQNFTEPAGDFIPAFYYIW
jgi:hypothetical protein